MFSTNNNVNYIFKKESIKKRKCYDLNIEMLNLKKCSI